MNYVAWNRGRPRKLTNGMRDDFAHLYGQGASLELLAKHYDCCVDTVRARVREWELQRPSHSVPRKVRAKELKPSTLRERWVELLPEMIREVKKAAMP